MNAVWNSYGQLCGCPEIFKKSCKFFCRELDIRVSKVMNTNLRQPCSISHSVKSFIKQLRNNRLIHTKQKAIRRRSRA